MAAPLHSAAIDRETWQRRYRTVRDTTLALCEPLSAEDCAAQSMPDASPAKWHLAHTTWFFETFILERETRDFRPVDPHFRVLFNSYYNSIGEQHPRPRRGLLTRPGLDEVHEYRRLVDQRVIDWLDAQPRPEALQVLEVGLHHEQQHQELLLMDIKHLLSCNPLRPAYRPSRTQIGDVEQPASWIAFSGGARQLGHAGCGFAYDNELPRHTVQLQAFELAARPVSNEQYMAFMDDDGYRRPELWLSDGWSTIAEQGWTTPLYWFREHGGWYEQTLSGPQAVVRQAPVCHISYYEADAFARWAGARLPTEAEWETAAARIDITGNFLEQNLLQPAPCTSTGGGQPAQMFGDVWEWTASGYSPYPGYTPPAGALGEYNGKFMCNQLVLRGGGCVTPSSHIRATYRNFFYPHNRWQFGGLRLARDPS